MILNPKPVVTGGSMTQVTYNPFYVASGLMRLTAFSNKRKVNCTYASFLSRSQTFTNGLTLLRRNCQKISKVLHNCF